MYDVDKQFDYCVLNPNRNFSCMSVIRGDCILMVCLHAMIYIYIYTAYILYYCHTKCRGNQIIRRNSYIQCVLLEGIQNSRLFLIEISLLLCCLSLHAELEVTI